MLNFHSLVRSFGVGGFAGRSSAGPRASTQAASRTESSVKISVGPLLIVVVALMIRARLINFDTGGPVDALRILWLDLPFLTAILLLSTIRASFRRLLVKLPWVCIQLLLVLIICIDTGALILINRHAWPGEILWVFPIVPKLLFELPPSFIGALLLLPLVGMLTITFTIQSAWAATFVVGIVTLLGAPAGDKTSLNHLTASSYLAALWSESPALSSAPKSSPEMIRYAKKILEPEIKPIIPRSHSSIVLLINESLSSVDSKLLSGVNNYYPRLDRRSKEGMLYVNGFANAYNSFDGLLALLTGVPPISRVDGRRPHKFVKNLPSRIKAFVAAGYRAEFLIATDIRYGGYAEILQDIGFQQISFGDNVERFRTSPRFVWSAPPDHVLYEELLDRIEHLRASSAPFLIVVETISGHRPFMHPKGGPNSEAGIRSYVDQSIDELLTVAKKRGYFDDTLFIITGDHRKQQSLSAAERERFGIGAMARIPVLYLGAGVTPGRSSALVQQIDLLHDVETLAKGDFKPRFPVVFNESRWTVEFGFKPELSKYSHGLIIDTEQMTTIAAPYRLTNGTISPVGDMFPTGRAIERWLRLVQLGLEEG